MMRFQNYRAEYLRHLFDKNGRLRIAGKLLLLIVVASLISACNRKASAEKEGEATPEVSVRVAKVERQPIKAQASAPVTIFPREQSTVRANINALIMNEE